MARRWAADARWRTRASVTWGRSSRRSARQARRLHGRLDTPGERTQRVEVPAEAEPHHRRARGRSERAGSGEFEVDADPRDGRAQRPVERGQALLVDLAEEAHGEVHAVERDRSQHLGVLAERGGERVEGARRLAQPRLGQLDGEEEPHGYSRPRKRAALPPIAAARRASSDIAAAASARSAVMPRSGKSEPHATCSMPASEATVVKTGGS